MLGPGRGAAGFTIGGTQAHEARRRADRGGISASSTPSTPQAGALLHFTIGGDRCRDSWANEHCIHRRQVPSGCLLERFRNIIPNQSLHLLSATVSLCPLPFRALNFGVGGGPNPVPEGLLAALSTMRTVRLPGLWVVLTNLTQNQYRTKKGLLESGGLHRRRSCTGAGRPTRNSQTRVTAKDWGRTGFRAAYSSIIGKLTANRTAWQRPVNGLGTLELNLA